MRVRQTGWAAVVVMLSAGAAAAQDVPVEPPVPPPPPVRIEAIPNGYQIFLNRPAAEPHPLDTAAKTRPPDA